MVCAALWLNAYSPYVGPLASRVGGPLGSDFSVFIGLIVGGLVYFAAGAQVRDRPRARSRPRPADLPTRL